MATSQYIGASYPGHEDEVSRRRRVKEANLAAFDATREQGRSGRSMVTASAFDGNGMRRDYMGGQLVGEMPLDDQARIGADFDDLAMRSAAIERHNVQLERNTVNALMRQARKNGGMVPQNLVDQASANFGMDGKNRAVFRAGYLDNGDFDIDIVTRGQNGGLQMMTKKISPLEQYNMMLGAPGVWGAEGQAVADGLYQRLRGTRGKSELAAPSTYGQNLSAYQDGQRTKQEMQAGIELLKLAKEFSGNGKGGEEALLKAVVGNKAFASILARGDRIYEDAAGNEVDNPYEEDGKTLRNDVRPKRDDEGNVMYREDPELAFQRIHKAWERVSAGGGAGGGGGGIGDAIMQVALSHLSPRQPSPEEAEIAQRQRQNALEDQKRADVMRGREQQLIHYIDENGTHKVGSGYVVDGKVYDGKGNEMSGVQLADRNGRPLQTAQAQPSTQDGQDGGALLRQMRGGQPPAAQGGEQSGPGGAQRAVQSEDSPIQAPNGESETTHNGKRYRWGWNKQQGRWAYNPVGPTRDEALAAEKARRRRNGGQMRKRASQAGESEPPKLDSPSTTNNSVPVSIGTSLPSRQAFDEEPMLPEERERREAERERREAELLEQNRRESVYRRFMDEHGRGPTEDELKAELARLAKIAG